MNKMNPTHLIKAMLLACRSSPDPRPSNSWWHCSVTFERHSLTSESRILRVSESPSSALFITRGAFALARETLPFLYHMLSQ